MEDPSDMTNRLRPEQSLKRDLEEPVKLPAEKEEGNTTVGAKPRIEELKKKKMALVDIVHTRRDYLSAVKLPVRRRPEKTRVNIDRKPPIPKPRLQHPLASMQVPSDWHYALPSKQILQASSEWSGSSTLSSVFSGNTGGVQSTARTVSTLDESNPKLRRTTYIEPVDEPDSTFRSVDSELAYVGIGMTFSYQKDDVVEMFCRALLRRMLGFGLFYEDGGTCREHSLSHLRRAIREFSKTAVTGLSERNQNKVRKLIRHLSPDIARKVQESVLNANQGLEHSSVSGNIDRPKKATSPNDGNDSLSGRIASDAGSCDSDSSEDGVDDTVIWKSFDMAKVLDHLEKQSAFTTLARIADRLFERYHTPKMSLIRHQVSRILWLSLDVHQMPENSRVQVHSASFRVDWDLQGFLERNYTAGAGQKLAQIISVTGFADHAKLSTVDEYFRWCWPNQSKQPLLAAIEKALGGKSAKLPKGKGQDRESSVTVDATIKVFKITGTEDFIVSMAQQIAWLAAVCQDKRDRLSVAYVGFTEADNDETSKNRVPTFDIDVRIEDAPSKNSKSCWNVIVGPAVIVTGFPIPERTNGEQGLEISIPVIAALSGTPNAVTVSGGAVFKGRCHALVPVEEMGSSLQWHVIDTFPEKLEWTGIDDHCPQRLRGHGRNKKFWSRRSFLGWCPRVLNFFGTADYDYKAVQYSKAGKPPAWAKIENLTFGFSQWVTLTTDIAFGIRDGFQCQRPDDYELLLHDARSTKVILYDTKHRRGFQTNGEDLMLHILQHRNILQHRKSKTTTPEISNFDLLKRISVYLSNIGRSQVTPTGSSNPNELEYLRFANPDRRAESTQITMGMTAKKTFRSSSRAATTSLFKNEVKQLWSTIDGLWANTYTQSKPPAFSWNIRLGKAVGGWEYMDLVGNQRNMDPKFVDLRKTCGDWHHYAKDIKALVLFAADLGDLIRPAEPDSVCGMLSSVPSNQSYLAVQVSAVIDLFSRQGSLDDQEKLTPTGLTLQGPQTVFELCDDEASRVEKCNPKHILRLVKHKKSDGKLPLEVHQDGAVIIGSQKGTLSMSNMIGRVSLPGKGPRPYKINPEQKRPQTNKTKGKESIRPKLRDG